MFFCGVAHNFKIQHALLDSGDQFLLLGSKSYKQGSKYQAGRIAERLSLPYIFIQKDFSWNVANMIVLPILIVLLDAYLIILLSVISAAVPGWLLALQLFVIFCHFLFLFRSILSVFLESFINPETIFNILHHLPIIMIGFNIFFILLYIISKLDFLLEYGFLKFFIRLVFSLSLWALGINLYYAYKCHMEDRLETNRWYEQ